MAEDKSEVARLELDALANRIKAIYVAFTLTVTCGLFICLSISLAFLDAFVQQNLAWTVAVLFVLAMFALTGALLMMLREIYLAITAPRHTAHR
jgi:formate/nitrite transporter FocA (FNT family)